MAVNKEFVSGSLPPKFFTFVRIVERKLDCSNRFDCVCLAWLIKASIAIVELSIEDLSLKIFSMSSLICPATDFFEVLEI